MIIGGIIHCYRKSGPEEPLDLGTTHTAPVGTRTKLDRTKDTWEIIYCRLTAILYCLSDSIIETFLVTPQVWVEGNDNILLSV